MKLSVIVPVYNVEPYIRRCLDSLINQTFQNLEIILVDDGSTDQSGLICDEYARMDKRVQVIHKTNEGLVSARQAGIQCATGEYATNVDSDDWIEKDAYEFVVQRLERYHSDMMVLGYKKEYAGFTEEYVQQLEAGLYSGKQFWNAFYDCVDVLDFFCQPIDMSLCNKVIKTELLRKHQMNCRCVTGKNEDDAVVFPCLLDINNIEVETACYYHYCVRKKSLLWESKKKDYEFFLELARMLLLAWTNSVNKDERGRKFLLYKLYYHLMLDVPEKLMTSQNCMIYPQLKAGSNIIIYGKGVFATRLADQIRRLKYCNIAMNIDKADIERILEIQEDNYDYIVIAILNCAIAGRAVDSLIAAGAAGEKILRIEKENLTSDFLPEEVRRMLGVLSD